MIDKYKKHKIVDGGSGENAKLKDDGSNTVHKTNLARQTNPQLNKTLSSTKINRKTKAEENQNRANRTILNPKRVNPKPKKKRGKKKENISSIKT